MIKVISWNIWGGKNLEKVISFLKSVEWDVLALQEVTERKVEGKINDAKVIANYFNSELHYSKAFRTDRHFPVYDLGNAIISKLKIKNYQTYELSGLDRYQKNSTTEPRNAAQITITINNNDINLVSTHLGYDDSLGEGELQSEQLAVLLKSLPREKTILLGDFNSTPESKILKTIEKSYLHTDQNLNEITWTNLKNNDHPKFRIDYIFRSPDIKVNDFKILDSDASDHLPLYAELEI